MRRFMIGIAVISSLSAAASPAAESFDYGYSKDAERLIASRQSAVWVAAAMYIPEAQSAALKNSKITEISFYCEHTSTKDAEVYLTHDLGDAPFYTGSVAMENQAWVRHTLTEPQVIDGRPIYVCYKVYSVSANDLFTASNGLNQCGFDEGSWIGISKTEEGLNDLQNWNKTGNKYGQLCITAKIESDNNPLQCGIIAESKLPGIVTPHCPFALSASIVNAGGEPIDKVSYQYTVSDGNAINGEYVFDSPVEPTSVALFSPVISVDAEGESVPVTITYTGINGRTLQEPYMFTADVRSTDSEYRKSVVVEEFTGTGCQYCPRGIVGLEEMSRRYRDGSFIPIAIHNYKGDPMECASYSQWEGRYGSNAPSCTVNRISRYSPSDPNIDDLLKAYNDITMSATNFKIEMQAYPSDDESTVKVDVLTTSAKPIEDTKYGIAVVLTQDKIGPYMQVNGFAGSDEDAGGFETQKGRVSVIYNDVARVIDSFNGMSSALPKSFEKHVAYSYSRELPLKNCTNLDNASISNVNAIALLVNRVNGEIETAAKVRIGHQTPGYAYTLNPSAVDEIADAKPIVSISGRTISINGNFDNACIYSISGQTSGNICNGTVLNVEPGIYVVQFFTDNAVFTKKVCVY